MKKTDEKKITVKAIKTDSCYYVSFARLYKPISSIRINGKKLVKTFSRDWWKVNEEPKTLTITESQKDINHRYVIKDVGSLAKINLPEVMPREEVMEIYKDEDGYESCEWKEDLAPFMSRLYELKSDPQDPIEVEHEFELVILQEVEHISEEGFSFKTKHSHVTQTAAQQQEIDKIVFPDIMAPALPCALSSEQVYNIVREHIKQNIDSKHARITSDYDFCFTVKKVIDLEDTFERVTEIKKPNGKPYSKRRYNRKYIKSREVEVFEMTYKGENHGNYTPIDGIVGKSWKDLREKVDTLLNDLITMINEPLVDCPHCKGQGVVLGDNNK